MAKRSPSTRFRAPNQRPGPSFVQALALMRAGGLLQLTYIKGAPVWELGGFAISPETVALLACCQDVEPTGDALFSGAPGQTWRIKTGAAP